MGTWGYGLFDNQLAQLVRQMFFLGRSRGEGVPQITSEILAACGVTDQDDLADLDPDLILPLVAMQALAAEYDPRLRDAALAIIDTGADLLRWAPFPDLLSGRRAILSSLRQTLQGQAGIPLWLEEYRAGSVRRRRRFEPPEPPTHRNLPPGDPPARRSRVHHPPGAYPSRASLEADRRLRQAAPPFCPMAITLHLN